ncbi:hypothetical protein ZIOFF_027507 [Zingiber officinale]|uniref:Uncharacterized protein n=1 Tax=Zingiber officinale TaxID=94328 RepID=A0A8J5GSV9_ZINOF|nr:hypothetical protein ZIOFF_027507 [Zingiber officinale]
MKRPLCFSSVSSLSLLLILLLPLGGCALEDLCGGSSQLEVGGGDAERPLRLKLIAVAAILSAGGVGVVIPLLGRSVGAFRPESELFFLIKAFAAGVILATGLVHILPDAFGSLTTSPCAERAWGDFPVAGFVAMSSALATMMLDSAATSYYERRSHFSKARPLEEEEEGGGRGGDEEAAAAATTAGHGRVRVHTHATHGHAHGAVAADSPEEAELADGVRHRVISQVLELGILVHSVIIGVSLGASQRSSTIRPLLAALSFHQFFEGIGKVQRRNDSDHGSVLLPDSSDRHLPGHRHRLELQPSQLHCSGRGGRAECCLRRDPNLHVSGGSAGGRPEEPENAAQRKASTGSSPRSPSRCRLHVPSRQVGMMPMLAGSDCLSGSNRKPPKR